MRMPAYEIALPDVNRLTKPIGNAIMDYRGAMDKRDEFKLREQKVSDEQKQRRLKEAGNLLSYIKGVQDPTQKQALYKQFQASDPDFAKTYANMPMDQAIDWVVAKSGVGAPSDPTSSMREYKLAQSQGYKGSFMDFKNSGSSPQTRYMNQDGNLIAIEPGKEPKVVFKKAPSIAERMLQGLNAEQPQPPAQGGVIQQSNPVAPQADPHIQLTAGDAPQAAPQQEMVQIPGFPPMPREKAQALRSAMALEGNKAGVDLLDSALSPKSNQIGEAGSNEVDKQLINSGNALSRLFEIQRQFKPEYQTFETKFGMAWTDFKDKWGVLRKNMPPEERQGLEAYRKFRLSAIDNINRYIKEITGAQMSEAEAVRLRQGAPDAGDGLFGGDGPTTFKAKMDQTIRTMGLAQMRSYYLKKNGFAGTGEQASGLMSLEQMENKVEERTQALLQDATARGLSPQQAIPAVKQQLQQEFGIAI